MLNKRLTVFEKKLNEAKAKKKILKKSLAELKDSAIEQRKEKEAAEKARIVLQEVAQATQAKLEYNIENLVTLALHSVFPDPYNFKVQFLQKRNKTECELLFEKNETYFKPLESSGGGPIDVASLALRLTFWKLTKSRPVLILDEPLKFVSSDLRSFCGKILKDLSEKMGVQIIMISHLSELLEYADNVIDIEEAK